MLAGSAAFGAAAGRANAPRMAKWQSRTACTHRFFGRRSHTLLCCRVARPLAWPVKRVVLAALGDTLLTEGLQFWAVDRDPRWIDVGFDIARVLSDAK